MNGLVLSLLLAAPSLSSASYDAFTVLPFYVLNDAPDTAATTRFREAYCEARRIAETEATVQLFNTAIGAGDVTYTTRELFDSAEAFESHFELVTRF